MNAAPLLDHYARVADAPNAISRLRSFVLDLAVRGKLVEQDTSDEAASELLVRISAERAPLVKSGEAQKSKDLADVVDEAVFDLPPTWVWTRLGSITSYIQRGKSPKYAEADGVPVISQKCVQWSGLNLNAARLITRQSLEAYESIRFLRDGDLLWNSTGTGTIGRIVRLDSPLAQLVCDSHVTVVRCLGVNPEYVRIWLRSDHVYGTIEGRAAGSTNQVELTGQMAIGQVVPLPPVAEQHRIVAKVDELMALCDQLEAARAEREAARDTFALSTLAKLNTPVPETFGQDARFALANLAPFTTRADQIKQLRQTILNLAVRGKLVEQDAADVPSISIIEEIDRLIAAGGRGGKRKASDGEPSSTECPAGWRWTTLSSLAMFENGDRSSNYPSGSDIKSEGVPFISTKAISNHRVSLDAVDFVSPEKFASLRSGKAQPMDILITLRGSVGKFGLFSGTGGYQTGFINAQLLILRCMIVELVPFVLTYMRSDGFAEQIRKLSSGSATPQLSAAQLALVELPLPPLAEQHRIVAKVDELMALCDQLEASLTDGEQTRSRLLESVLHNTLEPA